MLCMCVLVCMRVYTRRRDTPSQPSTASLTRGFLKWITEPLSRKRFTSSIPGMLFTPNRFSVPCPGERGAEVRPRALRGGRRAAGIRHHADGPAGACRRSRPSYGQPSSSGAQIPSPLSVPAHGRLQRQHTDVLPAAAGRRGAARAEQRGAEARAYARARMRAGPLAGRGLRARPRPSPKLAAWPACPGPPACLPRRATLLDSPARMHNSTPSLPAGAPPASHRARCPGGRTHGPHAHTHAHTAARATAARRSFAPLPWRDLSVSCGSLGLTGSVRVCEDRAWGCRRKVGA